jgi:hypothetical protein
VPGGGLGGPKNHYLIMSERRALELPRMEDVSSIIVLLLLPSGQADRAHDTRGARKNLD